jgi:hypothetical protein
MRSGVQTLESLLRSAPRALFALRRRRLQENKCAYLTDDAVSVVEGFTLKFLAYGLLNMLEGRRVMAPFFYHRKRGNVTTTIRDFFPKIGLKL